MLGFCVALIHFFNKTQLHLYISGWILGMVRHSKLQKSNKMEPVSDSCRAVTTIGFNNQDMVKLSHTYLIFLIMLCLLLKWQKVLKVSFLDWSNSIHWCQNDWDGQSNQRSQGSLFTEAKRECQLNGSVLRVKESKFGS